MSFSRKKVQHVIVYDPRQDAPYWVTVAQSARIRQALSYMEQIDESSPEWEAMKRRAGPEPEVFHLHEDPDAGKAEE